jgi:hypothetical protein
MDFVVGVTLRDRANIDGTMSRHGLEYRNRPIQPKQEARSIRPGPSMARWLSGRASMRLASDRA